jgi:hypothetical protein
MYPTIAHDFLPLLNIILLNAVNHHRKVFFVSPELALQHISLGIEPNSLRYQTSTTEQN